MKTIQVVNAYNAISAAKLTKMEDADKFKAIKIIRSIKAIALSFEDFAKDARESLKDDKYPEMEKRAKCWNEKHANNKTRSEMSEGELKELDEINAYFGKYAKVVNDCIEEEAQREYEPDYEKLSEEAFGKFICSNDFPVNTIVEIQEVLM